MLSKLKDLGKDSLFYSVGSATSQLLSVLLIPYFTDALSPEDYGKLATLALITNTISPISNLGVDSALFRHFIMADDADERNGYFFSAFSFKIVITIAVCALFLLLFNQVNSFLFESSLSERSYNIFVAHFFFFNVSLITALSMRASRKANLFIVGQLFSLAVGLLLSIYFVIGLGWGIDGAQWANLAGQVISTWMGIWYSKSMIKSQFFDFLKLRKLLSYGTPYIMHRVQGAVVQGFTAFTINKWMGVASLGVYSVASKFSKPIELVVNSVQKAWSPYKFHVHKTEQDPSKVFSFLIPNYWATLVFGWGCACFFVNYFIQQYINERFAGAMDILPFVLFIPLSLAFCWTVGTGYEMNDNQRKIPESSLVSMLTLFFFAFLLKDFYNPIGWILAQSLSIIAGGIYLHQHVKKTIAIDYQFSTIALALILQSFILIAFYQAWFPPIVNLVAATSLSALLFALNLRWINGKGFFPKVAGVVKPAIVRICKKFSTSTKTANTPGRP